MSNEATTTTTTTTTLTKNSLEIFRSSRKCGKLTGNDEIILFCSHLNDKYDIEVEFVQYDETMTIDEEQTRGYESIDDANSNSNQVKYAIKWKELAYVDRDNIHANSVLVIRTPPFTNTMDHAMLNSQNRFHTARIRSKQKVFYRLFRPSTNERSADWVYYYFPELDTPFASHLLDSCCMFGPAASTVANLIGNDKPDKVSIRGSLNKFFSQSQSQDTGDDQIDKNNHSANETNTTTNTTTNTDVISNTRTTTTTTSFHPTHNDNDNHHHSPSSTTTTTPITAYSNAFVPVTTQTAVSASSARNHSPSQTKKNMKKSRSNSLLLDKILLNDPSTAGMRKSRTSQSLRSSTMRSSRKYDPKNRMVSITDTEYDDAEVYDDLATSPITNVYLIDEYENDLVSPIGCDLTIRNSNAEVSFQPTTNVLHNSDMSTQLSKQKLKKSKKSKRCNIV